MKSVLVVVDYQNDFVAGALGFPEAKLIEQGICSRILAAREGGEDVLFTLDTHSPDYLSTHEGKNLPVEHCVKPTDGWKLMPAVAALAREGECIEKPTFGSLELAQVLRGGGYGRVELCGVVTNICVLSNAVLARAALPEAEIVVRRSLCASNDRELESEAFDILENLHITVL